MSYASRTFELSCQRLVAWVQGVIATLRSNGWPVCEELRPYLRRELGWPLYELGRIRLHKKTSRVHGQYLLSGHVLDTAMTAAGAQVLVQVGDRLGQPGMMRPEHRTAGGRAAQADVDILVRSDRQLSREGLAGAAGGWLRTVVKDGRRQQR